MLHPSSTGDVIIGTTSMQCPICGNYHHVEEHERQKSITFMGRTASYLELYMRCPDGAPGMNDFVTSLQKKGNDGRRRYASFRLHES